MTPDQLAQWLADLEAVGEDACFFAAMGQIMSLGTFK